MKHTTHEKNKSIEAHDIVSWIISGIIVFAALFSIGYVVFMIIKMIFERGF